MNHLGTKRLETERLILRKFEITDAKAMFNNWTSDDDVTRYLTWPTHQNIDVSNEILKEWTQEYSNNNYYQWAIVYKENGDEPIGSIGVVGFNDEAKKAHIGYCIGKQWWHKGITAEALLSIINFLFDEVGVQRIESRHDSNNPNSGAVMKKCGMQYEGTMRKSDWNNQGICDACYYAILSEDR